MKYITNFFIKDDGAVTVDWVVLTAVIVGLAIAVLSVINTSLLSTSTEIAASINPADNATTTATATETFDSNNLN